MKTRTFSFSKTDLEVRNGKLYFKSVDKKLKLSKKDWSLISTALFEYGQICLSEADLGNYSDGQHCGYDRGLLKLGKDLHKLQKKLNRS